MCPAGYFCAAGSANATACVFASACPNGTEADPGPPPPPSPSPPSEDTSDNSAAIGLGIGGGAAGLIIMSGGFYYSGGMSNFGGKGKK